MPYTSMQYLTPTQLALYNISDPCTVTCTSGYSGEFCQNQSSLYSNLPMGPWNQAGYYTNGNGLLRSMSIKVSDVYFLQYTKKDSVLIGISGLIGSSRSKVVEISLYNSVFTTMLLPPVGGSLDSLVVRKGVVYVARTKQVMLSASVSQESFDVVSLSAAFTTKPLISPSARVFIIEVFADKGTVTTFVYLDGDTINACYPDGTCSVWAVKNGVNGLVCGADCPSVVYASFSDQILRVTSSGFTVLAKTGSLIYCLTSVTAFNVLIYKSTTTMYQYNLATSHNSNIPLGITETGITACSSDVSETNNQILIVQNGVIRTLEAVQLLCGYGLTSQPLLTASAAGCVACPAPPDNAKWIEGSSTCEWVCLATFKKIGSKCVPQMVMPCPSFYISDRNNAGLCTPSLMPWASQGKFVSLVKYSPSYSLPAGLLPYPLAAISPSVLIETSVGNFYVSRDNGLSWNDLQTNAFADSTCSLQSQNRYYYISSAGDGNLWVAFFVPGSFPVQHCLWAVDALSVVSAQNSLLTVRNSWSLGGRLCSATGDSAVVYILLCGSHFLSYSQVKKGSLLSPLSGSVKGGYADGPLLAALFRQPSSMVLYDKRLYVADTGNCVIRELDIVRGGVSTVAGVAGKCQRVDDGTQTGLLVDPTNLTYTPFEGFFIFVDKYVSETHAVIRQFHIPSFAVSTIKTMPSDYFNEIIAVGNSIIVRKQGLFQILNATSINCPAGTSSFTGGALSSGDCTSCGEGFYSDAASGSCRNCSTLTCLLPGQLIVPCQSDRDSFCGACTNKPSGNTQYVGPSFITGTAAGGGDCPWTYTPPCPVGYYASEGLCSSCPPWSTTASAGSTLLSQCQCLGNGIWKDGVCVVAGTSLQLFPVLTSCPDYAVDSPSAICPCEPGEYIQQINPKLCTPCQHGYYSPSGTACLPCPDRTESSLEKTTCRCVSGLRDASAVTESTPQCVCGPGKSFSAASLQCTACEANTYSTDINTPESNIILSRCLLCAGGTFSGSGASGCTSCPFGKFRLSNSPLGCQDCPAGMYAPYATSNTCIDCAESCGGVKEAACPTDASLYICSPCVESEVRANAFLNGERNCATSCQNGYFELDDECVQCTAYNRQTCSNGSLHVPCSAYRDAACVPCINTSMPLNYAVWAYASVAVGGPNAICNWECEAGYEARQLPVDGVQSVWECVLAEAWSVWDLFTI